MKYISIEQVENGFILKSHPLKTSTDPIITRVFPSIQSMLEWVEGWATGQSNVIEGAFNAKDK